MSNIFQWLYLFLYSVLQLVVGRLSDTYCNQNVLEIMWIKTWLRCQVKVFFCGGQFHPRYVCRAQDTTCFSCSKPGHFARVCQSKMQAESKATFSKFAASASSIEQLYLASAPASLKPAMVNGLLLDDLLVHVLVACFWCVRKVRWLKNLQEIVLTC